METLFNKEFLMAIFDIECDEEDLDLSYKLESIFAPFEDDKKITED